MAASASKQVMAVLRLARAMLVRAGRDALPTDHPMRRKAVELHDAYEQCFLAEPPQCPVARYVDCFIRAFAEWRVYTGGDEVTP